MLKADGFVDELEELLRREKEADIMPDPELDAFMKAEVCSGKRESIVTELTIKMLGLDVSASIAAMMNSTWHCVKPVLSLGTS